MSTVSSGRLQKVLAPDARRVLVLAACLGLAAALPAAEEAYEAAPTVRANDLLSSRLLQSPYHRVLNEVGVKGNSYRFELESEFGSYDVLSLAMLEIRVREVRTIARAVNQYAQSNEEFVAELRGQLEIRGDSVQDILTAPISAAAELASQLTSNIEQTLIGEGGTTVTSRRRDPVGSSGTVLAAHKRNVASQLDLDVYSSNPAVQKFFDAVAQARSGGKIRAGVGLTPLARRAGPSGASGRLDREIRSLLRRLSAEELEEGIADEFERMGVPVAVRSRLSRNRAFSPKHKTVIANYLDSLGRVENRAEFINAIAGAVDENEALAAELMARMFALYHDRVEKLREFRASAGLPLAATSGGGLVVVFPFDIVYWTKDTDALFSALARYADAGDYGRRDLALAGRVTPRARRELTRLGFRIYERFLSRS